MIRLTVLIQDKESGMVYTKIHYTWHAYRLAIFHLDHPRNVIYNNIFE
jgi:hypothetical protein